MYKECFKLMDVDKDGTLSKNDLRAAFDNVGKLMDESELDSMLGEVGGSCTFDAMVKMFQEKMAGGKQYTFFLQMYCHNDITTSMRPRTGGKISAYVHYIKMRAQSAPVTGHEVYM